MTAITAIIIAIFKYNDRNNKILLFILISMTCDRIFNYDNINKTMMAILMRIIK